MLRQRLSINRLAEWRLAVGRLEHVPGRSYVSGGLIVLYLNDLRIAFCIGGAS